MVQLVDNVNNLNYRMVNKTENSDKIPFDEYQLDGSPSGYARGISILKNCEKLCAKGMQRFCLSLRCGYIILLMLKVCWFTCRLCWLLLVGVWLRKTVHQELSNLNLKSTKSFTK